MKQDNAEGSSKPIGLSAVQEATLVGTLLGDGCLAFHGRYPRLHVKHKLDHRELVEFKYEVFRPFVTMELHCFDQKIGDSLHPCLQFATRTRMEFVNWHRLFYGSGRKAIPGNIATLLSEVAIAVWFMDDGAADHHGVTFQTHSFTEPEVELLIDALFERHGLRATKRVNRGRHIIYVGKSSMGEFRRLISDQVLPTLQYKLVPLSLRTP